MCVCVCIAFSYITAYKSFLREFITQYFPLYFSFFLLESDIYEDTSITTEDLITKREETEGMNSYLVSFINKKFLPTNKITWPYLEQNCQQYTHTMLILTYLLVFIVAILHTTYTAYQNQQIELTHFI